MRGTSTYSPYRDGIMLAPNSPVEARQQVYQSNINAIKQSDLVIAVLNVRDTGTTWEFGGANMLDKPVISVITDPATKMNVMLSEGVLAHVTNLDDLRDTLFRVRPYLAYGRKITLELMDAELNLIGALRNMRFSGETQ